MIPDILIKFSEEQHIDALMTKGELYFSSLDYIINCDKEGISDKNEKRSRIYGSVSIKKEGSNEWINLQPDGPCHLTINSYVGNIYCLTGYTIGEILTNEENSNIIDPRMERHGEFFCIIHKPIEFIKRIVDECKKNNFICSYRSVTYKTINQDKVIPFEKDDTYSFQKEFRVFIENPNSIEPIKLYIGSINDIAFKGGPNMGAYIEVETNEHGKNNSILRMIPT